jgi:hypothetical protein
LSIVARAITIGSIAAAMLPIFSSSVAGGVANLDIVNWHGGVMVKLSRDITRGDVDRVYEQIHIAEGDGKVITALELESVGGDGDAAVMLADFVYRSHIKVVVKEFCYSACTFPALVALGHGDLLIGRNTQLGVHQAMSDGKPDIGWTKTTARILHKYGAPSKPLEDMVSKTPPALIYYGPVELEAMGATWLQ